MISHDFINWNHENTILVKTKGQENIANKVSLPSYG